MGTHSADVAVSHWFPNCDEERTAVRAQLERVLASPLFSNSKRYPILLRYVVEESLNGRAENLKERTLGIEVFKRDSHYDTNIDPVVRVTAGEVRKRLAQYYYEPGHEIEIHIELPAGSYVPEYRKPETHRGGLTEHPHLTSAATERTEYEAFLSQQAAIQHAVPAPSVQARQAKSLRRWVISGAVVAVLIGSLAAVLIQRARARNDVVNQFWGPLLNSPNPALLCLGDRASWDLEQKDPNADRTDPMNLTVDQYLDRENEVFMTDVLTMNRIAATLQSLGKRYRIQDSADTNYSDLRAGPAVLIGADNNIWTHRITQSLRFAFALNAEGGSIIDRQNPAEKDWAVPLSTPYRKLDKDYGIVARLRDPSTDQPVFIAAGLASQGTFATGEMLSNTEYLKGLLQRAPKNWQNMNMEAVITTEVIDGKSGPPRVLAVYYW
jgi:hypothetical protein